MVPEKKTEAEPIEVISLVAILCAKCIPAVHSSSFARASLVVVVICLHVRRRCRWQSASSTATRCVEIRGLGARPNATPKRRLRSSSQRRRGVALNARADRAAPCEGADCCFHSSGSGAPARPFRHSGLRHCIFCSAAAFRAAEQVQQGKYITTALRKLAGAKPDLGEKACQRIASMAGAEVAETYRRKLPGKGPGRKTSVWDIVLKRRKRAWHATKADKALYAKAQANDGKRLSRKFPSLYAPPHSGKADDTAWQTPRAKAFRKWCLEASWRSCEQCGRMCAAKDLRGSARAGPTLKECQHCQSQSKGRQQHGYWAPEPDDQHRALRHLSLEVVEALRPVSVFVGPRVRAPHGYLLHSDMVRFAFKPQSVEATLAALPRSARRKALEAYEFLVADTDNSYQDFILLHNKFLASRAAAIDRGEIDDAAPVKRLPANFLETVGLECCVWPHLYWRTDMTETFVRSTDKRRLRRLPGGRLREMELEEMDPDDADGAAEKPTQQSAKASFLAKVHGSLIGYGSDALLLHFVWDLWMWSSIGGAKNASGLALREALANKPFSPEMWKTKHLALVDLQKQIGWPSVFITISPYEWSMPYHSWVEDELQKTLAARLQAPATETLHITHILTQAVKGLLLGANDGMKPQREHVFAGRHGVADGAGVRHWVARLEFQDGKRKRGSARPAQFYHGSGRVHVHLLVWLRDLAALDLPAKIAAELPGADAPEMSDLVRGSQLDWESSGWPRREEASDVKGNLLRLRHPQDAHAAHCRAYVVDVLQSLRCHVDALASDGRALLLKYCASGLSASLPRRGRSARFVADARRLGRPCASSGYLPKFSDSFAQELLNDQATDFVVTRRILSDYHPHQPEMVLQLAAQQHPQFLSRGLVKKFIVPLPWEKEMPQVVQDYMASPWRSSSMSLLEYLRRVGAGGQIQQRYRRLHKLRKVEAPLEEWINSLPAEGEILVAAIMSTRATDRYCGQWLLLNVPFRALDDLWDERAARVPAALKFLTLCLLKRPGFWKAPEALRADLELEASPELRIENFQALLASRVELAEAYLNGELHVEESDPSLLSLPVLSGTPAPAPQLALAPDQDVVVVAVRRAVDKALEARWPEEEDMDAPAWLSWVARAPATATPVFAVLGPAGSGKSTAVEVAVRAAVGRGAHVGIACPTGMLASSYRVKFPGLDVDTVHGMFALHKPLIETLDMMEPYDLVVVDEVGQLSKDTFDRLLALWDAAARRAALVFVGDFAQLRGMDPSTALDSDRWVDVNKLHLHTMRRCKCAELRWKLELLRSASLTSKQLRRLLRSHQAPQGVPPADPAGQPTLEDIKQILQETPRTLFVTYTRAAAQLLNDLAVQAHFEGRPALGTVPGDPEANANNFQAGAMVHAEPYPLQLFVHMRVTITKNEDKEHSFVNGMGAWVRRLRRSGVEARGSPLESVLRNRSLRRVARASMALRRRPARAPGRDRHGRGDPHPPGDEGLPFGGRQGDPGTPRGIPAAPWVLRESTQSARGHAAAHDSVAGHALRPRRWLCGVVPRAARS